jgi:hypothetical protein
MTIKAAITSLFATGILMGVGIYQETGKQKQKPMKEEIEWQKQKPAKEEAGKRKQLPLRLPPDTFVHHHVVNADIASGRYACANDEVMVGFHRNEGKVICASLNHGFRIARTIQDPERGTKVSSNPVMHGCPPNFFIQKMEVIGRDETLTCVSLATKDGLPLVAEGCLHDGRGKLNDGTNSTIYELSPTMHSCPKSYAMRGIHQADNDFYCCK